MDAYALADDETAEAVAPPAPEMKDSREYRRMFDESRMFQAASDAATKAQDYYDDKQLSPKMLRALRARKQPETVRNRIKPAINGVIGVVLQNEVDPRAYPRNPQQEQGADVASKVLRFIGDKSRWQKTKAAVLKDHLIAGWCAAIVEYDGKWPVVRGIPADRFFWDVRSRETDYSDAKWLGYAKWMYADDLAGIYPEYRDDIMDAAANGIEGIVSSLDENRPTTSFAWVDRKLRQCLVVEMYVREGSDWSRKVFFGGGMLEDGPSPYVTTVDGERRTRCPIEGSSCYIDRDNRRYGPVQSMIPLQDELNARASRLLHIANTRQVQATDIGVAMATDVDEVRKQASMPDGAIPPGWQTAPVSDMGAANAQIMAEVSSEIDRQAPTPATLGRMGQADSSGRSRLVAQQAGMTELMPALKGFEDFEERIYRQEWAVAQQFVTRQEFIRVTGDAQAPEFLKVNTPIVENRPARVPVLDPMTQQPHVDPTTGQPVTEWRMQPQQVGVENNLLEMDMDIEVDTVPDTANLQAETFTAMLQQSQLGVAAYGPKAWFDALWFLNPMPEKAEVKQILEAGAQQMAQQQQGAQQAAAQKQGAEVADKAASAQLKSAQAQHQQVLSGVEAAASHDRGLQTVVKVLDSIQNAPAPQVSPFN